MFICLASFVLEKKITSALLLGHHENEATTLECHTI
jgi:hypothetical protein